MAWRSRAIKEVIVYTSNSNSVWSNLAFEDWIFKNVDLSYRRILFLWRNNPCVVIGRHQNPWSECNLPLLKENGITLARRRSGGGTVYHDLGNLNVTLFTHRSDYDRPRNLNLVTSALNRRWNAGLNVNECNDIICNNTWKVSGSSSKLAKSSSYHHFTLLLEANISNLQQYISTHPKLIINSSVATPSRRSKVINLCSLYPSLTHDAVCSTITNEFYSVHGLEGDAQVITVDPTSEDTLPGILELTHELKTWEWNYGKTPKFTSSLRGHFSFGELAVEIEVNRGKIERCSFTTQSNNRHIDIMLHNLQHSLIGLQLSSGDFKEKLTDTLTNDSNARDIVNWLNTIL